MGIQVKDLFYIYSPKSPFSCEALKGISLSIPNNSFCAFVGRTGSGKSTLVQTLNALLIPSKGEIKVDDFLITPKKRKNKNIKQLRKHVGLVFQFPEYQLFEESVEKDVAFGLINFGVKKEEALDIAHKTLLSVGINEQFWKRSPFELSGGEKRKVAIAGILALEPDIIVLDEPTAGLDPYGVEEIMSLIKNMHNEGKTIILVTHEMKLVFKYCDHVFVINEGNVIFNGKTFDLLNNIDEKMAIELPPLYQLAIELKNKGIPLDISTIKETQDLINQINKWRRQ